MYGGNSVVSRDYGVSSTRRLMLKKAGLDVKDHTIDTHIKAFAELARLNATKTRERFR